MPLFRMVDGVRIELTSEEEAQVRAEWAANAALPRLDPVDAWAASGDFNVLALQEICKASGVDFEKVKATLKTNLATARIRI